MTQILTAVCLLGPPVMALMGLLARLRWQARRDQRRQDTLRALTADVPSASVVDIHDIRDDGSQLRLRITPAPTSPSDCHE
ncbi:hypothetical protein [Kutzneria buriramensis]|uniref:Uncharacterized protein n=1 Tax=Kutzneria buriramensis TaxID=1045776 RepID=A0A3E0GYR2_9PSEU|nr:hypothetical protein [Kutzneria buriramensis]REH31182.1 hypothetical protein BCF44_122205 [Kutzneria buriramensis]